MPPVCGRRGLAFASTRRGSNSSSEGALTRVSPGWRRPERGHMCRVRGATTCKMRRDVRQRSALWWLEDEQSRTQSVFEPLACARDGAPRTEHAHSRWTNWKVAIAQREGIRGDADGGCETVRCYRSRLEKTRGTRSLPISGVTITPVSCLQAAWLSRPS